MHDVDLDLLEQLLKLLREHAVDEFVQGDFKIVLRPKAEAASASAAITAASPNPKLPAYKALFKGNPPSFEQFRDACIAIPTAE